MFHMSLLEQDITRKRQVNNQANQALPNNMGYKIEAIVNDAV